MAAGDNLTASRLAKALGTRVETTIRTSDGAAVSAETTIDSVTFDAVAGRTYRITSVANFTFTATTNLFYHRIREDSSSGGQLTYGQLYVNSTAATWPSRVEAEWTASSTGSKTIVSTITRASGAGTAQARGAGSQPGYLYVDYVRG